MSNDGEGQDCCNLARNIDSGVKSRDMDLATRVVYGEAVAKSQI